MKKSTYLSGALLALMAAAPMSLSAESIASASTDLYNFDPWSNRGVLELFVTAADNGRSYPTEAEFNEAGIYMDLEFARSHTRYNPILTQSTETNLVADVFPTRRIWMNLPTGTPKITGGYPSSTFDSDAYTMWNYTHIFGSWNHNLMQAPGVWVAAAHKNGTYMYSGIEFFDATYGDASQTTAFQNYTNKMNTKNDDGTFKYVDAVLNCLIFLGQDGINYNFEAGFPTGLSEFHAALYKRAKEIGFDSFHIGGYSSLSSINTTTAQYMLYNNTYGKVMDTFLNYSSGDFAYSGVANSLSAAKSLMGTAEDVYQGAWVCTMDRNWIAMNQSTTKEMNLVLWGEHAISRFFQFNVGTDQMNKQDNYQIMQDRLTSGGNRSSLNRPTLTNSGNYLDVDVTEVDKQLKAFGGFASMAPERSAIQGNLPFNTNFIVGNGDIYFYKGKKTADSWYNMGAQDYVPTYRWLLTKAGDLKTVTTDPLDVRFTHEEAYIGGSSVRLSGKASATDVVIYKSALNVQGAVNATIAVKPYAVGDSHLSLILKLEDGTYLVAPYGQTSGTAWEEKTIAVPGSAAGQKIAYIGVRVEGADENFKLDLGQITLDDNSASATPASIDENSVDVEVKEETNKHLSVKMAWAVNDNGYTCPMKERGMVYNDEVNIDHFQMLVKNGEDGKAYEVGRTATWHAYFGNIDLEKYPNPYVGIRAISTDLKSTSPIVWVKIDRYADQSALPQETEETKTWGESYLDLGSDGASTALETRWIEEVTTTGATGNLNYTRTTNAGNQTNYVLAEDVLTVTQGQTVTVKVRGHAGNDDIKYCMFKAWLDWDIDYIFNSEDGSDEVVWTYGTSSYGAGTKDSEGYVVINRDNFDTEGATFTLNVPTDAVPGETRLRFVACDAWFKGALNATGGFNKGYALDIPVKIEGTNPGRGIQETYLDRRDAGEAEEVNTSGVNDITFDNNDANVAVTNNGDNTISFTNVEKAWIYTTAGQLVKYVGNADSNVSIADLANGIYIVKMQNGQVIRSAKLIKK
jgi:hypothetical protein